MVIEYLKTYALFKYLWLKSVEDVDLTVHCAKCIIGKYDNRIKPNIGALNNITLENGIYYLCGVAAPFVWEKNFHLAFKYSYGDILEYANNGIAVKILNAKKIDFSSNDIDDSLPQSKLKSFYSCRNWQFANLYKRTYK